MSQALWAAVRAEVSGTSLSTIWLPATRRRSRTSTPRVMRTQPDARSAMRRQPSARATAAMSSSEGEQREPEREVADRLRPGLHGLELGRLHDRDLPVSGGSASLLCAASSWLASPTRAASSWMIGWRSRITLPSVVESASPSAIDRREQLLSHRRGSPAATAAGHAARRARAAPLARRPAAGRPPRAPRGP